MTGSYPDFSKIWGSGVTVSVRSIVSKKIGLVLGNLNPTGQIFVKTTKRESKFIYETNLS